VTPLADTIERSVVIQAPIARVWALIAEPGWWINDGEVVPHEITWDGDVATVVDPKHGEFRIQVVAQREPEYAAYRWMAGGSADHEQPLETLVEFFVADRGEGVDVRVVESGWTGFDETQWVRENYAENTEGWEIELAAARSHLQPR
jgi:uncharacterized protein YndB with AHSA1/START domain